MRGPEGLFSTIVTGREGQTYTCVIDGTTHVDPAARWLEGGTAGPARLLGPVSRKNPAPDRDWAEVAILEVHIGTFTHAGTFAEAASRMPGLADLGFTAIEIMPVAAFGGTRGWGYDGVFPYAVHPAYGTPQDFADLIDAIHSAGMLALLDVVYNHFGPEGCGLGMIAPPFFDKDRDTPWGPGIDFTKSHVRQFFIGNAAMWIHGFGVDGLRLDAVHQIFDPSPEHILDELARTLRAQSPDRAIHLIAEDERNLPHDRDAGTITANWNDDYHHAVHCLLTGETEGYYSGFAKDPMADLVRALAEGHVEQGQFRNRTGAPRGAPSAHLPPTAFINANQTHDQIGNRARGERLIALAAPEAMRVAHAMLLTAPAIPMLFMGEEEGARAPFLFFADFTGDLAQAVRKGRAAEFAAFSQFGGTLPDPLSAQTFAASRPYDTPAPDADEWRALTRLCLQWRARMLVPLLGSGRVSAPDVAATGAFALRATWRFQTGTLSMVAHLGAVPDKPSRLDAPDIVLGTVFDPFHFAVKATHQ